jgi:hypothetical protein
MDFRKKDTQELYDLAFKTSDVNILKHLSEHENSTVRRIVAKNNSTTTAILNTLACDPVLNVSFMAGKHPKCTLRRDYTDISNPCISCEQDERTMICTGCKNLEHYYGT